MNSKNFTEQFKQKNNPNGPHHFNHGEPNQLGHQHLKPNGPQPQDRPKQPHDTPAPGKETDTVLPPNQALEQALAEAAHWKDLALRATAEMENLRKRTQIDLEKNARYATGSFAKDLLPVADCLEQAMACARQELDKEQAAGQPINPVLENLMKGVEMTQGNLMTALKKQNIAKMPGLGTVFDPNQHKVIQEVEDATKPAGTIVQELQPGYTIGGDRVLREAMVIVSK